jgi:3,4-dihydroxy 2-butanone 4-phosphate synthase / GTP cyclohydrolase II
LQRVRLLTNNPDKITQLELHGIDVIERVPIVTGAAPENLAYLRAKRDRMGHLIPADT